MKRYLVKPGRSVRLKEIDPGDTSAFHGDQTDAVKEMVKLNDDLADLQELLYAEHRRRVLIVLQGMDTSGKDGTIHHVFHTVNPQGVNVVPFKVPTAEELAHDFLWRVHSRVPGNGQLTIFNRSHYEDVLVVRVHKIVPEAVWRPRYRQINHFERMLAESGTTVLKFFLHISADEQKERLEARLAEPTKRWKFNPDDLAERKLWPQYMKVYEEAISRTSTAWAPWHIVPSNHKWYRNLVVARRVVEAMKGLKMKFPKAPPGLDKIVIK